MVLRTAFIRVIGIVQGVGYRPFIYRAAVRHGLAGYVRNLSGSVDIRVTGRPEKIRSFIAYIKNYKPAPALISKMKISYTRIVKQFVGFKIYKSRKNSDTKNIPSDIRTCPDCLKEFNDIKDRRYGYPFINCTNCGPRFTIIEDTPYDRKNTSMKNFEMCPQCKSEYGDSSDRRYHAEPNACPECGPRAWIADAKGTELPFSGTGIFQKARELLMRGKIVAVKGLGGFHIAADASNIKAVNRLRAKKNRLNKPFAVMAATVAAAKGFVSINRGEEKMLKISASPIVLLKKNGNSIIGDNAAAGLPEIGVFLPYTPLHYLLFDDNLTALVMTSANLSEEPIQFDNAKALKRLSEIADYYILHDRTIVMPSDDSVIKPYFGSKSVIIRRSRGFVPVPVALKKKYPDIVAVGALLKNTACFIKADQGIFSQHIGDLENRDAFAYFEYTISKFIGFYGVKPKAIACDKHPDFLSTIFAEKYSKRAGIPLIRVQHHHAHMLSVMAERGYYGPAIGVILDGSGYGDDGNMWGGEILAGSFKSFERKAHFKYLKLPGGDIAAKQPYRTAISALSTFLSDEEIVRQYRAYNASAILEMLRKNINITLSSGAGRFFDAAASILDICHKSTYDAEAPMKLEAAASGIKPSRAFKYTIEKRNNMFELNFMPTFRDLWRHRKSKSAAADFHDAIACAIIKAVSLVSLENGMKNVVLAGGVFQNTIILGTITGKLKKAGFNVLTHKNLPPNDGSIALGQAAFAAETINQGAFKCV